jgi:cytochrome b6-f complex iron-sulfur subunit
MTGTARTGQTSQHRRGFFRSTLVWLFGSPLAVGFTALTATFSAWFLASLRFMFPNVLIEPPLRFRVGRLENYGLGKVETRYTERHGVWIVHGEYQGQLQIYALQTECTHLGCTTIWQESEQKFKCPCHGSGFAKDGIHFEGPAPRPLERYAIRVTDDGQLEVDKSRTFRHELGEWEDPDSFIPV